MATAKQLRALAKRVLKCADVAEEHELLDERGGYIDCQLATLAHDMILQADKLEGK